MKQRRTFQVRTILLCLLVLPLAGLSFFAARDALSRWRVVQATEQAHEDAELVGTLLNATSALANELDAASGLADATQFGFDPALVSEQFGIDIAEQLAPARVSLDFSLADMARVEPSRWADPGKVAGILGRTAELAAFRNAVDAGDAMSADIDVVRAGLAADLAAASAAQLEQVGTLDGGGEFFQAVKNAEAAVGLSNAFRQETLAMTQYLLPTQPTLEQTTYGELVAAATARDVLVIELVSELDAEALREWRSVTRDPRFLDFERIRADALALRIDPVGAVDLSTAVEALSTGVDRLDAVNDFVDFAIDQVATEALSLGSSAASDLETSIIIGVIVALISLTAVSLISGAIVGPLSRLKARAERISEGDLRAYQNDDDMALSEVAVVDSALDTMVANLRVLETHAEALSSGDIPAIDEAPPLGRLGASLQQSVERLADMTSQLEHQARHDNLTGLSNRAAGLQAIDRALARGSRQGTDIILLFVDLDEFKEANDVHGHAVGDLVLAETANRLVACCPQADAVARLGGDEFLVVLADLDEAHESVALGETIVAALGEPIAVPGGHFVPSASVGIAWAPRGASSVADLLHRADLAVYRAKAAGKCRVEVYDEHLHQAVQHRAWVESGLEKAIEKNQLELWYQPIVAVGTGRISGLEALVRWRDHDGRLIPPDSFITIAERTNLILDVDRWVIGNALAELAVWQDDPAMRGIGVSVNISGRHLITGDLVGAVGNAMRRVRTPAGGLTIELTETELLDDLDGAASITQGLRDLGVGVAIDDFGTGYLSVAHLRRLAIDRLKIDRTYVAALNDATDRSITELMVWLGRTLKLDVVAEGVETDQQLETMSRIGCTHAQGYLLARPMPAADVAAWVVGARGSLAEHLAGSAHNEA